MPSSGATSTAGQRAATYGRAQLLEYHASVCQGDVERVVRCLRDLPDLDARGPTGDTALSLACQFGHVGVVDALLEAGAEPDLTFSGECFTPLMVAGWSQNGAEIARLLLAKGADLFAATPRKCGRHGKL